MSNPYLGEIRIFSGNFAPRGWAMCNGQVLPIQQNAALFSILGTTYGGNGETTFALPNLQGNIALHPGTQGGFTYGLGQTGGEAQHTVLPTEMAQHSHILSTPTMVISQTVATDTATTNTPGPTTILAKAVKGAAAIPIYAASTDAATTLPLNSSGHTDAVGGSQSHNNLQPYLAITFIIALEGNFPSRN